MVDASGTSAYGCYLGGQLASETGPWAANTVSYGYSSRLRVALANQQPTGSWTNGYSYDPARRLTGISGPSGSFGYLYVNAANVPGAGTLVGRVLLPNSAYLTNTYDSATRNALGDILSPSVANNWEYGGLIYYDPGRKSYFYTTPVTQKNPKRVYCWKRLSEVPKGCWVAGLYHSHAGQVHEGADEFSEDDKHMTVHNRLHKPIKCYMISPTGTMKCYEDRRLPGLKERPLSR